MGIGNVDNDKVILKDIIKDENIRKKNVKTKKEVVLILTTLQWSTMEEWQYN